MNRTKDGWYLLVPNSFDDPGPHPLDTVRLQHEQLPGWAFTVRFGDLGEVAGFAIDEYDWRVDERQSLNASFWHSIRIGEAIARARTIAVMMARATTIVVERIAPAGTDLLENAEGEAVNRREVVADLTQWAALVTQRAGVAGKSDLAFALVAAKYVQFVEDGEPAPLKRLAKVEGFSSSTIRNQVYEARIRGLLTATKPGVSGGRLTAKARRLLKEEGLT